MRTQYKRNINAIKAPDRIGSQYKRNINATQAPDRIDLDLIGSGWTFVLNPGNIYFWTLGRHPPHDRPKPSKIIIPVASFGHVFGHGPDLTKCEKKKPKEDQKYHAT